MPIRSLPRIVIPMACTVDWHAMRLIEADGRARLCGRCDRPVYDSRSMTHGELEELIVKHEGSLPCLRLHRRPDGTIVTGTCLAPVLRAGRLLWLRVALAAVAFWSAVVALRSWMAPSRSIDALPTAATLRGEADAKPPRPSSKRLYRRDEGTTMGEPVAGDL